MRNPAEAQVQSRGRPPVISIWVITGCLLLLSACGAHPPAVRNENHIPKLALAHFETADGRVLPVLSVLPPRDDMKALIVAVHGFNDYKRAFSSVAPLLRAQGIGLMAYDQQGFGMASDRGMWAGIDVYARDLRSMLIEAQKKFHGIPIYVLGESMGAAVAISAFEAADLPGVSGVILSAPAVWSRDTMPWYQQLALSLAAWTVPEMKLTGSGLRRQASDNLEMLRELGRDPWVIKETRVAAIQGLADLMDRAQIALDRLSIPLLVLYGGRDEIIPKEPVEQALRRSIGHPNVRVAFYPFGFHLLLRDIQAEIPLNDLCSWILAPKRPLPSGCEVGMSDFTAWELKSPGTCRAGPSGPG